MLTVPPPQRSAQPVLHRWDWHAFLVGWCAAFHGLVAVTLFLAPWPQIYNAGTAPVFALASRYVWASLYLAAGAAATMQLRSPMGRWQFATWLTVFPLGATWLTAFTLAVLQGSGSALSIVVWPFLYGPWAVVAVRVGLGKR